MDHIQTQLSVSVINNYYVSDDFGRGFSPTANARWAHEGFTYPNEHHGTYFLRLAGALPFGATGQLDEELRPLAFTSTVAYADPHKTPRHLLVQPVPRDVRSSLLRPPVAVWRGIGSELRKGLSLVSLYVQQIAEDRRHQDPNHDWKYHSFLSIHQVTVKPPPKQPTLPEPRRRGRDRPRNRAGHGGRTGSIDPVPPASTGPVQVQYLELFILTVCSAPASDLDNCFAGLIPPPAPFSLPCFPIALCGWWLEMASSLEHFTSNELKIGPSLELLTPSPTARINGLKQGATVSTRLRPKAKTVAAFFAASVISRRMGTAVSSSRKGNAWWERQLYAPGRRAWFSTWQKTMKISAGSGVATASFVARWGFPLPHPRVPAHTPAPLPVGLHPVPPQATGTSPTAKSHRWPRSLNKTSKLRWRTRSASKSPTTRPPFGTMYETPPRQSTCSSTLDKGRFANVVLETIMLKLQRYNGC